MILYLSIVGLAFIIVSVANIFSQNGSPLSIILVCLLSILYELGIDAIFAFLADKTPKSLITNKKIFFVSKKEQKFYVKLGVRKWKDKVWELGKLSGFSKSKIEDYNSIEYAERFLFESFKGEIDHLLGMILGFTILLILPHEYKLSVGLPIACTNLLINLMSFIVLRYNTPRLIALRTRAMRNNK